jgi:hypothetical protein
MQLLHLKRLFFKTCLLPYGKSQIVMDFYLTIFEGVISLLYCYQIVNWNCLIKLLTWLLNLTISKLAILFKTSNWDFFCIFCYYPFKAQFQIDWNMKIIFDVKFYIWFMDGSYCYLILHGKFFPVSNLTSLLLGHFFSNSMS